MNMNSLVNIEHFAEINNLIKSFQIRVRKFCYFTRNPENTVPIFLAITTTHQKRPFFLKRSTVVGGRRAIRIACSSWRLSLEQMSLGCKSTQNNMRLGCKVFKTMVHQIDTYQKCVHNILTSVHIFSIS